MTDYENFINDMKKWEINIKEGVFYDDKDIVIGYWVAINSNDYANFDLNKCFIGWL